MVTNNITKLSFHNVFNLFFRNLALYAKSMHALMATIWKRGQGVMTIKTRNEYLEQYYLV